MCTLTWRAAQEGGYDLFFNRDESDTRPAERPPVQEVRAGVRCVAPRDGTGTGTWLVLNEHGLTFALLNHYPEGRARAPGTRSRGELALAVAPAKAADEASGRLTGAGDLREFAPFHAVTVDANGRAEWLTWDGTVLRARAAPAMLTSSSFDTARVEMARATRFGALVETSALALTRFHRSHDPEDGAASICMRRTDGHTRSVCEVHVRPEEQTLTYRPALWAEDGTVAWGAAVVVSP